MSKPSVDIGRIGIWYGGIDALPTPEAQRAAQLVEELGFSALWVAEAVGRDPFVSSAVLLGATSTLKLATGIANIYARDPMTMAAGQKTLAEAFPGRFLLGLGVSHGHLVAGIRKHDYSKPYSYMAEYLDKMDKALFMARGPEADPGRILAALGPKMLELSATRANGSHRTTTTTSPASVSMRATGPTAVATAWSMPSWRGAPRSRSRHVSPSIMRLVPTMCACRCCRMARRCPRRSSGGLRPRCWAAEPSVGVGAGQRTRKLVNCHGSARFNPSRSSLKSLNTSLRLLTGSQSAGPECIVPRYGRVRRNRSL